MAIGFSQNTRFVRESRNHGKVSTSIRLIEKDYENKKGEVKSYYEGAVQLANGQWVWIAVGGTLDDHMTKDGRRYVSCKVSMTEGKTSSKKSPWN